MSCLEKAKKKKKKNNDCESDDDEIIMIKERNDPTVRKSREPNGYDEEYVRDLAGNIVVPTFF